MPRSLNPRDRAEIEADLVAQGVDASVDDVVASFDLFERTALFPMDPEPAHPALGPDWRYEPLPGEEGLFADDLRANQALNSGVKLASEDNIAAS